MTREPQSPCWCHKSISAANPSPGCYAKETGRRPTGMNPAGTYCRLADAPEWAREQR